MNFVMLLLTIFWLFCSRFAEIFIEFFNQINNQVHKDIELQMMYKEEKQEEYID